MDFSKIQAKFKFKKGFTLIELLLVITILGVLAALTLVSYENAQGRSRDSRRKQDLDAIKKSLTLVLQDSAGSYSYPRCDSYDANNECTFTSTSTTPDVTSSYIPSIPTDPKTKVAYKYIPTPAACTAGNCTTFTLRACLENTKDNQAITVASGVCTSTKAYQITN